MSTRSDTPAVGEAARPVTRESGSKLRDELHRLPIHHRRMRETVIEPRQPGLIHRLKELWRYRHLITYFMRQTIRSRYNRMLLGRLWLILRPSMAVGTQALVFGGIIRIGTGSTPYLIFFIVGVGAWNLFSQTTRWAVRSLEQNRSILRRMYIPRLVLMVGSIGLPLTDYCVYLSFLGIALIYYLATSGVFYLVVGLGTLVAPAGLALLLLLGFSIGLWLAPFAAKWRDVRYGVRYGTAFLYFLTPVIYPLSRVPAGWRTVAALNPATTPIEMVKYGFFRGGDITLVGVISTLSFIAVLSISGLWFYGRKEAAAVDHL